MEKEKNKGNNKKNVIEKDVDPEDIKSMTEIAILLYMIYLEI